MKKLTIILIILIVVTNLSYSQVVQTKERTSIEYTNYCLEKFRKEHIVGLGLNIVGGTIMVLSQWGEINGENRADIVYENELLAAGDSREGQILAKRKYEVEIDDIKKIKKIGLIAGTTIGLAGVFFQNINYRWLKRAYLGENGIGVTIPLNK